jgi:hypothetical protein
MRDQGSSPYWWYLAIIGAAPCLRCWQRWACVQVRAHMRCRNPWSYGSPGTAFNRHAPAAWDHSRGCGYRPHSRPRLEELAADQATDRRAARIEARPFGQVIWLQLSWGGLTSGALLAGVYQAEAKDGVVGSRRYLMNGLMDGLIAGHLVETAVSCTPIDAGPDLYACATGRAEG